MADYKILATDYIKTLQKLSDEDAPAYQLVDYIRRNSSRIIFEDELNEILIEKIRKAKDCVPKYVTIELELKPELYEAILKNIKGTDLTVEDFIVYALRNYIIRRGI